MVDPPRPFDAVFDRCPDPLALIEGDALVAMNRAFRERFGEVDSLLACIDAADHAALSAARAAAEGGAASFVARAATGPDAGAERSWTIWPAGDGVRCLRLDGPATGGAGDPRTTFEARTVRTVVDQLPMVIWAMEADGTCTLSIGGGLAGLGLPPNALVGTNLFELYKERSDFAEHMARVLAGERSSAQIPMGEQVWLNQHIPLYDASGQRVVGVSSVAQDVTERVRNEERLRAQVELIELQKQEIASLQSPMIEVWEGVLVVPVIGSLDADRCGRLLERLLEEVVRRGSRAVVVDLTGLDAIDTATTHGLQKIMRSLELVGCAVLVSGIQPSVAKAMVELQIDLAAVRSYSTLAEAIRRWMARSAR